MEAILATGFLAVAACVGSDPTPASSSSSSGGSSSGASSGGSSGTSGATDGGGDVPLVCDAPKTACGSSCIDAANNPDHCGRCDRKCGASSTCSDSLCSPQTIATLNEELFQLGLGAKDVYVSSPARVQRIAKAGGPPTPFVKSNDQVNYATEVRDRTFSTDANNVYWAGYQTNAVDGQEHGIFKQSFGSTSSTRISGQFNVEAAAAGDQLVAWTGFGGNGVYACAPGPTCAAETNLDNVKRGTSPSTVAIRTLVVSGTTIAWASSNGYVGISPAKGTINDVASPQPDFIAVWKDVLYWTDEGNDSGAKPAIYSCAVTGCGGGPKKLVESMEKLGELAVDDTGVYYTTPGDPNGATGTLHVCTDKTNGCTTTPPVLLGKNLQKPKSLAVDATDVYVTTHPTTTTGNVIRVAK